MRISGRAAPAALLAAVVGLVAIAVGCAPRPTGQEATGSGLRTFEEGTGSLPAVLLHGYGSTPREWLPFTRTIVLPPGRRFVFPEGPETTSPPEGPRGGRAWWPIELARHRRSADGIPDFSAENPPGLAASTRRIRLLLHELAPAGYARQTQWLGGFSQGAMISADVAFTTDEPLGCLVLFSPSFVNETGWRAGMPARKGLRVFVSHGRRDDILPFDGSQRLAQAMRDAGLRVTWVPFDGGHEIPIQVVTALNRFLAAE
jgi:phospholipase/carboxylesterase